MKHNATLKASNALASYIAKHPDPIQYAVEFHHGQLYAPSKQYQGKLYSVKVDLAAFCQAHRRQILDSIRLTQKAKTQRSAIQEYEVKIAIAKIFDKEIPSIAPQIVKHIESLRK